MSENISSTATSGRLLLTSLRSGRDWATWLRHAQHAEPPGRPAPSPGQAEAAWTALAHLARRHGFAVERGNCAAADGFTTWRTRRIRIRPDAAPAHAATALTHQLGHILLHGQIARLDPSGTIPCQGIRKVEADSVAYLVTTDLGIDAPATTFPHVSSWAGTDPRARPAATIQAVSHRVLAAAAVITAHLDAAPGAARQATAPALTAAAEPSQPAGPPLAPRPELIRVHETAARFFRSRLPGSWVPGYLSGRGFGPAVQQHWHAGHAPAGWDTLTCHLRHAGYPDTLIEAAGLARRSRRGTLIDTFRDRAMLPIRSADGTIVGFIGRAPGHAGPGVPKYLNSPRTALYDKSEVLFGLWEARDALTRGARPVIVEGPFDAIAVTTASPGRHAGLAPCGTALTTRHAAALDGAASLRTAGVLVAFDPDNAGYRAAVSAYHLLSPLTDEAAAVNFPAGQDPAQILRDHGPAALAGTLTSTTRPLADLVIDAEIGRWSRWLQHADGQVSALHAAAPLIAAMPVAHVARQVARLTDQLGLDHAIVTEAVTDALTALVTAGPAAFRPETTAHQRDQQGLPSAVTRAIGNDCPHTAQQAIARAAATAAPPPGQMRPAGTEQARLRARRVPG